MISHRHTHLTALLGLLAVRLVTAPLSHNNGLRLPHRGIGCSAHPLVLTPAPHNKKKIGTREQSCVVAAQQDRPPHASCHPHSCTTQQQNQWASAACPLIQSSYHSRKVRACVLWLGNDAAGRLSHVSMLMAGVQLQLPCNCCTMANI
eukprot:1145471-Pelagomonas_calceolata.AAC.10